MHPAARHQVRLLLGEIPERVEFSAPGMREPLTPYFELTCAVRSGDLATFRCVCVGVGVQGSTRHQHCPAGDGLGLYARAARQLLFAQQSFTTLTVLFCPRPPASLVRPYPLPAGL